MSTESTHISVNDLAARLSVHPRTVHLWLATGKPIQGVARYAKLNSFRNSPWLIELASESKPAKALKK